MNPKILKKLILDVVLIVLLLLLMAFELIGREFHEWLGTAMLLVVFSHHLFNRKWSKVIFKGKYAGAGGDDPAGESPQRSQPEKESLQQQVCLIQHCLLPEVRGDLPADRMEQPGQTLHSLEMLHPCGAWPRKVRCSYHSGIGTAGGGGKSHQPCAWK